MKILILTTSPYNIGVIRLVNALIDSGVRDIFFTKLNAKGKYERKKRRIIGNKIWTDGLLDYLMTKKGRNLKADIISDSTFNKTDQNKIKKIISRSPIIKISGASDRKLIKYIKKNQIDLGIYQGIGILRKNLIKSFKIGILNSHMGSLPKYKGMNVLEWSLFYKDVLQITHHFIDPGIDTGDIIAKYTITISEEDTIKSLRQKARMLSIKNIPNTLNKIVNGDYNKQESNDGTQYFVMHNTLKIIAESQIKDY